ncbi:hypothetical protein EDC01DRAFT_657844 [Geopyxis carbonaria]|nr:hypothetical protein EDC01DRAFT_657844 [Geopyxis carbonaria]
MVLGTHNGNIHILALPSLAPLRTYHAHSASITSISISPPPPPPTAVQSRRQKDVTHDRYISVATSSIDGLVCAVPLLPSTVPAPGQTLATVPYAKTEITLKNFKRPILAVALSPNFRADRIFLSGGLAGNLVLSVAPAGGGGSWMTLGMGGAKDTVLHSGEGAISAIAWSRESPRYVAWTNEQGIKIMRSHIIPPTVAKGTTTEEVMGNPGIAGWIPGMGSGGRPAGEVAWKRISAIERPESIPEELAALHKPRLEWIDRRTLVTTEPGESAGGSLNLKDIDWGDKEKLVVGWGGTVWVINVFAGSEEDEKNIGWAQITHIFQTDCAISGIHMYTPSLLLLLAYMTQSDEDAPAKSEGSSKDGDDDSSSARFRRERKTALIPELRFIDLETSEEVSADELMMSRSEGLAVGDYHLGVLPAMPDIVEPPNSEGGSGIGAGIWAAAVNPTQIFSSAASVITSAGSESRRNSVSGASSAFQRAAKDKRARIEPSWGEDEKGTKIFITSPYDVVFATERSQKDHLQWMLEHEKYQEAWHLIDKHPEVVDPDTKDLSMYDEEERKVVADRDGYSSDSGSSIQPSVRRYSSAEKEKRRIGELWLQKQIQAGDWADAGATCGAVLGTSSRWEHWVWVFEAAGKIREITAYIPTTQLSPPLPSVIYEIVLAHYLRYDRPKFKELLYDTWKPEGTRTLYDARTIVDAVLRTLNNREDEIKPGGRDWSLLQGCLAKLYTVLAEPRNALKRYIMLKDAQEAFTLIRQFRLVDAVADDIASILLLRVSDDDVNNAPIDKLEELTREPLDLLVDEADKGILSPSRVVTQLQAPSVPLGPLLLFLYLRRLWHSASTDTTTIHSSSPSLLAPFGDLMVSLFAEYDRPLLLPFLRTSHFYTLSTASQICERRSYIPELVHLLSKTGQTKRALFLIIDSLHDVAQAIAFARTQDDPDLWRDLLDYSMDKPAFIRGLLENVGTSIDPITLVRRIPAALPVPGLKPALQKILREYGVQWSLCDGVATAMRSEVARGMDRLRHGQRRGVKFAVGSDGAGGAGGLGLSIAAQLEKAMDPLAADAPPPPVARHEVCGVCRNSFTGAERGTLVAFACCHVFHLRCITGTARAEEEAAADAVAEEGAYARTVGAKVTHAALIREKVREGCGVCREARMAEIIV